ncbi:hypothetical protein FALBO_4858 [Fusarium albosuccineum]|uniref:Uncharacterized protein n=1 Tax=Fusarium albosuccineum TaxID=1237068 RepID=A0A8H4PAC3_9HYPO|nr:hypothetical protein FALBO_4858 [Fusarium albosuccineum]
MMLSKISVVVAALLLQEAWALSMRYPLCLTEPALTLEAGKSPLSVIVNSPMENRCEAALYFSDPSFLPVRYSFKSLDCDGGQILTFTVPKGSPSGDFDIIWQCTGLAPICNHGVIYGGDADSSIPSDNTGRVGCLVERMETRTTLVTVTRSSTTLVETAPTVVVTSSTSYLPTVDDQTTSAESEFSGTETETKPELTTKAAKRTDTNDSDETTALPQATETETATTKTAEPTGTDISDELTSETQTSTAPAVATLGTDEVPKGEAQDTTNFTPTGDGVFVSTAPKTYTTTLVPAVTASIISTLTVIHTVTAKCTAAS